VKLDHREISRSESVAVPRFLPSTTPPFFMPHFFRERVSETTSVIQGGLTATPLGFSFPRSSASTPTPSLFFCSEAPLLDAGRQSKGGARENTFMGDLSMVLYSSRQPL